MGILSLAAVATLVFCAPGSPGAADDAQPLVDAFAQVSASSAGWKAGSLAAVYDPTEAGGLAKLNNPDTVLTFVPYPFYMQHGAELHLSPLAQADVAGIGTQERWTLVGKAGGTAGPHSMAGYTIVSVAGYAPEFVRHSALAAWDLPPDVKIEATGQILSALRRVAAGEPVVALLDQMQAAALASLPFAAQLKTLTQSPPVPVALLAVVDARLPAPRAKAFQSSLLKMSATTGTAAAGGADTLSALHLNGFVLPQLPGPAAKP